MYTLCLYATYPQHCEICPNFLPLQPPLLAMPTTTQRDHTEMRRKLYTGRARAANDRGGNEIPAAELAQLWSCFLDEELKLARSKLCLADVQDMLERGETPRFNTLVPRIVSGEELANISEWCDKYRAQLVADLGAPLGSVQNTLAGQASANHEENVDLHEQMRAELKAQICQLAPAATKRLVVNRHAFVTVDEGVAKYFLEDGGVWACCDAAPVEGRKYCKLVYVEQQKIGEPGVYYCAGQGTHKAGELHNWSTLVRVKTVEECGKPALPKCLHAFQGQNATVVSEDGDMLRVRAGEFGGKVFSVRRGLVEFLPPNVNTPAAWPPQEEARENAEQAEVLAAPCPAAAAEEQPAPMRAAKRTAEASTTELFPKRCRKDPKATAAPKTEAQEYKVGDRVVVASEKDGREMDGLVKSKEKNGYHRVWVQELDKTILRKLPQRAASSK